MIAERIISLGKDEMIYGEYMETIDKKDEEE